MTRVLFTGKIPEEEGMDAPQAAEIKKMSRMQKVLSTFPDTVSVTCLGRGEDSERAFFATAGVRTGFFASLPINPGQSLSTGPGVVAGATWRRIRQRRKERAGGARMERKVTGSDAQVGLGAGWTVSASTRVPHRQTHGIGNVGANYSFDIYHKGENVKSAVVIVNDEVMKNSNTLTTYRTLKDFESALEPRIPQLAQQFAQRHLKALENAKKAKEGKDAILEDDVKSRVIWGAELKIRQFLQQARNNVKPNHLFQTFEELKASVAAKVNTHRAIAKVAKASGNTSQLEKSEKAIKALLTDPQSWDLNYLMVQHPALEASQKGVNLGIFARKVDELNANRLENFLVLR